MLYEPLRLVEIFQPLRAALASLSALWVDLTSDLMAATNLFMVLLLSVRWGIIYYMPRNFCETKKIYRGLDVVHLNYVDISFITHHVNFANF